MLTLAHILDKKNLKQEPVTVNGESAFIVELRGDELTELETSLRTHAKKGEVPTGLFRNTWIAWTLRDDQRHRIVDDASLSALDNLGASMLNHLFEVANRLNKSTEEAKERFL